VSFERIQILGPFNSGTCLVFQYVRALFHVRVQYHTFVWKHSLPPRYRARPASGEKALPFEPPQEVFEGTLFLCMVRLPYFWILSTLRQPYGTLGLRGMGDASAALRSPIRFEGRTFANIAALWNAYYDAYREHVVPRAAVEFVRLEDLVQAPERTLQGLGRHLRRREGVDLRRTIAEISNRPAKRDAGRPCVYGEEARREYVPERVPGRFAAHDLDFLNRQLDPELMRAFGYPFVS
jgi:hypothetical protein